MIRTWRPWAALGVSALLAAAAVTLVSGGSAGADGAARQARPQGVPAPTARPTAIPQNAVLAIIVNWAAGGSTPANPADSVTRTLLNSRVAGASVAFQRYSYSQYGGWPSEAIGPVTIQTPTLDGGTTCGNSFVAAVRSAAFQAARNTGVEPYNFDRVLIYFPAFSTCPWKYAPTPFWDGANHVQNLEFLLNGISGQELITKVLGITQGIDVARTLVCVDGAGKPIPRSSSCSTPDSDPYSVMGAGGTMDLTTIAKRQRHWLTAAEQPSVFVQQQTTTVTIAPAEAAFPLPAGGKRGVIVAGPLDNTYYLEYRQPIGVDAGTQAATDGVLIYIFDETAFPSDRHAQSFLLDMTPSVGGGSFKDAVLRAGLSWTDPTTNIKFTVNGTNASGATVTFGPA